MLCDRLFKGLNYFLCCTCIVVCVSWSHPVSLTFVFVWFVFKSSSVEYIIIMFEVRIHNFALYMCSFPSAIEPYCCFVCSRFTIFYRHVYHWTSLFIYANLSFECILLSCTVSQEWTTRRVSVKSAWFYKFDLGAYMHLLQLLIFSFSVGFHIKANSA